jgi:3-isopropylmalate/(R)-2-methylmalate dehydratase small subunit
MNPFRSVTGPGAPLDRVDVDTDQIIPKQFLKRIEKTGYEDFLFFDWRFAEDGSPRPDFILNREPYRSAPILLAGRNCGCGASREHAAWALAGFGIRTVIAPSFADIFYSNCFQNGILPVTLGEAEVHTLMDRALNNPEHRITVDLEKQIVSDNEGMAASFAIDPFRRRCLLEGLDDIGLTLQHLDQILAYEQAREAAV